MTDELTVQSESMIMVVVRDESQPRLMAFNEVLPGMDPRTTPHGDIVRAVAHYMDVPDAFFDGYYVQPHGQNFTIMPKPEFGKHIINVSEDISVLLKYDWVWIRGEMDAAEIGIEPSEVWPLIHALEKAAKILEIPDVGQD